MLETFACDTLPLPGGLLAGRGHPGRERLCLVGAGGPGAGLTRMVTEVQLTSASTNNKLGESPSPRSPTEEPALGGQKQASLILELV